MAPHNISFVRRMVASTLVMLALVVASLVAASPASAAPGGTVSGTVTSTDPELTTFQVTFYPLSGSGAPAWQGETINGAYTAQGLAQGDYRVRFQADPLFFSLAGVWLGGSAFESESQILTVGAANVTGVDAHLVNGGRITGTITVTNNATDAPTAAAFLWNPTIGEWERTSYFGYQVGGYSTGTNYAISGLPDGEYLLRFGDQLDRALVSTQYWDAEEFIANAQLVTISGASTVTGIDTVLDSTGLPLYRVAGDDRFATSVAISQTGFPTTAESVFIVNGLNFPDALSAGPAAAAMDAPVLLVTPTSIPAVVGAELSRLHPATIYVIGGEVAVSDSVVGALESYASDGVVRLSGQTRYETSRVVANYFWGGVNSARTAYVATGSNFPDALGAGPAAANEHGPVILVDGAASAIDTATRTLLSDLGVTKVVLAGGTAVVSAGIESSLLATPFLDEVYRRAGANRLDTAFQINKDSFRVADAVFLATGYGFPDALAGTGLAGNSSWHSPIYLVQKECIPVDVFDEIVRLKPAEVYLLGGPNTLGDGVVYGVPCG